MDAYELYFVLCDGKIPAVDLSLTKWYEHVMKHSADDQTNTETLLEHTSCWKHVYFEHSAII